MSKNIAIVYWSGTGNTEKMAQVMEEGATEAGATAKVFEVSSFSADNVSSYDAFAFGCPSMGAEELEADEFEPVWNDCKNVLGDKPVVLFGSYGWGSGEWMDIWEDDAKSAGINVLTTVIANEYPNDDEIEECKKAASSLVSA